MRIAVVPTGRMEHVGLPLALKRLFPGHEFYALPTFLEQKSNPHVEFPIHSFTSTDVEALIGKPNNADKLLARALGEALGEQRRREAADLVIMLDDLELVNGHQPERVVKIVREAAQRHLDRLKYESRRQDRHRRVLQDRVSFHLAKPMIEAWVLADPAGPANAGCSCECRLKRSNDPEAFETEDADYHADDGSDCAAYLALPEPRRRRLKPGWLKRGEQRRYHPKDYLAWLCKDPEDRKCSSYDESRGGADALRRLAWETLFSDPDYARFARSMIADIAERLGIASPFPGAAALQTDLHARPQDHRLRNL
jgi:hypothetical protein